MSLINGRHGYNLQQHPYTSPYNRQFYISAEQANIPERAFTIHSIGPRTLPEQRLAVINTLTPNTVQTDPKFEANTSDTASPIARRHLREPAHYLPRQQQHLVDPEGNIRIVRRTTTEMGTQLPLERICSQNRLQKPALRPHTFIVIRFDSLVILMPISLELRKERLLQNISKFKDSTFWIFHFAIWCHPSLFTF